MSADKITLVDALIGDKGPIGIQSDQTIKLQGGDRSRAYAIVHQQMMDYLKNNKVGKVVIKASALASTGSTKMAHLESAELRGVVMAAAADVCETRCIAKAQISRTFGDRKADEYVKDDAFWNEHVSDGALRVGSREAALVLLAARGSR